MELVYIKNTVDNKYWLCRGKEPLHDIKINIRLNSVLEDIKIAINTLYFLLFNCFIKNMSITKNFKETANFCQIMKQPKPGLNTIVNIFRKFRKKIKEFYHKNLDAKLLGFEPSDNGVPQVEIDESEVVGKKLRRYFGCSA